MRQTDYIVLPDGTIEFRTLPRANLARSSSLTIAPSDRTGNSKVVERVSVMAGDPDYESSLPWWAKSGRQT
jgi:hypothetical protein